MLSDISSDAQINFYKHDFAVLKFLSSVFASLKTFQMSQSLDWYNSVKFLLKTTEPASKIKCSSSRTETSEMLNLFILSNRRAFTFYLFLFHIDCTIYTYQGFIQTTILNKRYGTHKIYRVILIPSVLTVFSLRTFTREVKIVQSYFNKLIKHSSFTS